MRSAISISILVLFCLQLFGQNKTPTPEEIQAMMTKIQKQADSMQRVINNKIKNQPGSPSPQSGTAGTISGGATNYEQFRLPKRDTAKIRSLPKKTMTPDELNSYLKDLYAQMQRKFAPGTVNVAKEIAEELGNHPQRLEEAAILAWQGAENAISALLITNAASSGAADGLLLTNAGAILDMAGHSENAIPILRTVVKYQPGNASAHNNLGQAYTAIGMHDSALHYFGRCLSLSPKHPEANNTAGLIELQNGNKEKAKTYFENSIYGSFNLTAYHALRNIDPTKPTRIAKLIRPKVKVPEYFNHLKYQLPPQCRNVDDAEELKIAHKDLRDLLNKVRAKYEKARIEAEKELNTPEMLQKMQKDVMQGKSVLRPYQALGAAMLSETTIEFSEELMAVEEFNKKNRQAYKDLENQHRIEYEKLRKIIEEREDNCCGEGDISCCEDEATCRELNALSNKYLEQFAQLNEEWQKKNLGLYKKYYEELVYWSYISSFNDVEFRIKFNNLTAQYIQSLAYICETKTFPACKPQDPDELEKQGEQELKPFDCYVDIEFPFIVGKLTLNCEKISFKAGEGLRFKFEKKFTGQRESTISLGIGGGIDATVKSGPFKAGIETGADMSVYITFDRTGNVSDGGMSYGAYRGMGIDFSAGERIKIKKEVAYTGEKIGWRFGVNSGVSFNVPKGVPQL